MAGQVRAALGEQSLLVGLKQNIENCPGAVQEATPLGTGTAALGLPGAPGILVHVHCAQRLILIQEQL